MTDVLWRVALHVPSRAAPAFEAALEPFCLSVSWFGDDDTGRPWTVEGLAPAMPDPDRLTEALATTAGALGVAPPDPEVTPLPPRDWLTENFRAFPPVAAGRFFVHGSHFEGAPPPGCRVLRLDAATAFGSGEHATTKGCLLALDALRHPPRQIPRRVLDMGCGSGILAMGAAKAWGVSVLACDIDPESVRVTRANARNNGVGHLVAALRSDGYRDPAVRAGGPYDLILANILARPLMAMAGDLASVLAPGGLAVLSGFVTRDARTVERKKVGLHGARRRKQFSKR